MTEEEKTMLCEILDLSRSHIQNLYKNQKAMDKQIEDILEDISLSMHKLINGIEGICNTLSKFEKRIEQLEKSKWAEK
jgi:uncharacterized protein YaaN involved in tellurite resistance